MSFAISTPDDLPLPLPHPSDGIGLWERPGGGYITISLQGKMLDLFLRGDIVLSCDGIGLVVNQREEKRTA